MPIIKLETNLLAQQNKEKTDKHLPTIIKWKGVNMIRQESFLAAVQEIVDWAEEIDVTRVGVVGDMHSGKTTMAETISHCIHANSKLPWAIKLLEEEHLMKFEETLKTLTTDTNWILRFDDVSFLDAKHNKKQISIVKEAVTKIRHLEGGKDVKIVLIYNYHYSKGLDKYLRMADFRFFTTVGSEEEENMEGIVGSKMNSLVRQFTKIRQEGVVRKMFLSPRILNNKGGGDKKQRFFYKWRNPFIPVLFWNNRSLRMIVSPTRQFIQPICSICSNCAVGVKSEVNIDQFIEESETKFTQGTFKGVIKQFLREQGMNTYSAKTVQARRYLDKALGMKLFSLEDLALHYGLKETKTKMKKKMPEMLSE